MEKRQRDNSKNKRWLLQLAIVLIPLLTLAQEVLWQPVKDAIQQRQLNSWAVAVMLLAVVVVSTLLSRWVVTDPSNTTQEAGNAQWYDKQQLRLLRRISQGYEAYLNQALVQTVRLEVQLEEIPRAVTQGNFPSVLTVPKQEHVLPKNASLLRVFDQSGGLVGNGVLVMGGPGAGKTTLLVELAEQLSRRAISDPNHPVPIYLPLSSWAAHTPPLSEWLVKQLDALYQIPQHLANRWLENGELLFLFDGLDEIPNAADRVACSEEINRFSRHYPLPLLVCCRSAEYGLIGTKLELATAVLVHPLDPETVLEQLRNADPQHPLPAIIANIPELSDLLRSPFLVQLLTTSYLNEPNTVVSITGRTLSERRHQLITNYVNGQFRRLHELEPNLGDFYETRYSSKDTLRWLASIARNLQAHQERVFLPGRLRLEYLPSEWARRLVLIAPLVVWGTIFGLYDWIYYGAILPALGYGEPGDVSIFWILSFPILGFLVGAASEKDWNLVRRIVLWAIFGSLIALSEAWRQVAQYDLVLPFASRAESAASYAIYFVMAGEAAMRLVAGELPVAERLSWSWKGAVRPITMALTSGLLLGFGLGLVLGRYRVLAGFTPSNLLLAGLAYGTIVGLIWGVTLGFTGGLRTASISSQVKPNEGLHRSLRRGTLMSLASLLFVTFLLSALGLIIDAPAGRIASWVLQWAPLIGILWGLHSGLGAAIQQLTLRILLWRFGMIPFRITAWLRYVVRLRLLYWGVGGGYAFIHGAIQYYFATTPLELTNKPPSIR